MTESVRSQQISSKQAVQNIIKYSDSHNRLLDKFNIDFFIAYFDCDTIQDLYQKMGKSAYSQLQFVKELTCFILHSPDQTLFLVISLIDIFNKIVNQIMSRELKVTVKDFTYYLCEGISNRQQDIAICTKQIPIQRIRPDARNVRDIDLHAAEVLSRVEKETTKISQSIKKKQKKVDQGKALHIFKVNRQKKELITLGRLSSHISIFDERLKKIKEIVPACCKEYDRSASISSMAFSQSQQRIGCIINHIGLVFWDYQDNFNTEKIVPKLMGDKIYYLPLLDEWITTTHNTIYFWDLKLEKIKQMHQEMHATALHDIEEVTHLRCLAVSYTMKDQYKWLYIYKNDKLKNASKVKLSNVGAQNLHYHRNTQTLLLLGSKKLPVYQIDALSLDPSLLKQLQGHQTIITAVADLKDGQIVTGDDRGNLRIWNLNDLRCYQTFRVANFITSLHCLDHHLFFSDSRLNLLQLEQLTPKIPISEQFGINKFYRFEGTSAELVIFTKVTIRVYNMLDGRVLKIIQLCNSGQYIIAAEQFRQDYLVSTSKSLLYCYSRDFKVKWKLNTKKYKAEQILHVRSDFRNHFFATVCKQGNIHVWNEKTLAQEGPRKSIINVEQKSSYQITLFDLSQKYSLIVSAQKSLNVKLWDYESCKLCNQIELPAYPSALKIANQKALLAVGCYDDKVYLYKISRKQNSFDVIFLQYAHLIYPQVSLNSLLSVQQISYQMPSPKREQFRTPLQQITFSLQSPLSSMAVCYGRGKIIVFNTNEVMTKNFRESTFFKPAMNVQRPVKEQIQKQITKNQFKRTQRIDEEVLSIYQKLKVNWNKKIHGDCITNIDICQNRYFATLSIDGYLKFITLDRGDIVASLSIRHPLPILWKLQISMEEQLLKKVHQALTLISQIIKDKANTAYDLDQLNVQPFMQLVCSKKLALPLKNKRKSVRLLKQELNQEDFQGIKFHQQSLKSMQAFRRVSLIKQGEKLQQNEQFEVQKRSYKVQKDKQVMMKMLSPFNTKKRLSIKFEKKDDQLFDIMLAKYKNSSTHVSPTKNDSFAPEFTNSRKSKIQKSKQIVRKMSQTIKDMYDDRIPLINHEKEDAYNRKVLDELKRKEPLVAVSNFLKNLNNKLPKQNQIKKHLKKNSCFGIKN